MVLTLTASGWGQNGTHFRDEVNAAVSTLCDSMIIKSLDWHSTQSVFQKLADFVDTTEASITVQRVAERILDAICDHPQISARTIVVSFSAGSLLVEEALALFPPGGLALEGTQLQHLMLAPAVGGSIWAKLGIAVRSLLVENSRDNASERKRGQRILKKRIKDDGGNMKNDTIMHRIDSRLTTKQGGFASIERTVLLGQKDGIVRSLPAEMDIKTTYTGDYYHTEVGSLQEQALGQIFTCAGNNNRTASKAEILASIVKGRTDIEPSGEPRSQS